MSFWINDTTEPILILSPMADFTDEPFSRLLRSLDKETIIFREMLSAEAIIRQNQKTLKLAKIHKEEYPVVQQLFGSNPDKMAQAGRIILDNHKPQGIDINMGCPVPKAVNQFNGAYLMKDPDKASKIVRALKSEITEVPITVKTRLGWSNPQDILEFSKIIEDAGADALSIHGRTKDQGYAGVADWKIIGEVKKQLSIPVFVNGDIVNFKSMEQALKESQANGLLIARGALGRPWIFNNLRESLEQNKQVDFPAVDFTLDLIKKHAEYQTEFYGERGLIQLRKHFPWYFKGIPNFRQYRAQAVQVKTMVDVDNLIELIKKEVKNTL